jgi:hypothetical protein
MNSRKNNPSSLQKTQDLISLQTGATPNKNEIAAVNFLAENFREPILFLRELDIKNARTADIFWLNENWEIKTPMGISSATIKRSFKVALRQSVNMIFDLRKNPLPDSRNVDKLTKEFGDIKKAQKLVIILKNCKFMELKK